jgi:hypothetical protein
MLLCAETLYVYTLKAAIIYNNQRPRQPCHECGRLAHTRDSEIERERERQCQKESESETPRRLGYK